MDRSITEIRQEFLKFFSSNGHEIVNGSSLIPSNDPSLLFTNSGMNQFKEIFIDLRKSSYPRVTTAQRCLRVGGKHNDLEHVGHTTSHHTFFEMLGNFSFGDYFKFDAINYAWELLTSKKWFSLPKERLWVTVNKTDYETYKIWKNETDIPNEHIIVMGNDQESPYISDNFWQMSDIGPCGPCTEIFYDYGDHISGNPPGSLKKTGERYTEIWNIVFIQFDRKANGIMEPLAVPSVDTGMGLERITAILQNVNSNYEIDLFDKLIKSIIKTIKTNNSNIMSLRIIADHIRSSVFLISEGIMPSNENRGYILRRIIRRAIRHGKILGIKETFFYKLVDNFIEVMNEVGDQLKIKEEEIKKILKIEEEQFSYVLERGLKLLNKELKKLSSNVLDGKVVFRLYDTYGLPIDIVSEICQENNILIDKVSFNLSMEEQRLRARKNSNFSINYNILKYKGENISEFCGYKNLRLDSKIIALFSNGRFYHNFDTKNQDIIVFLKQTPFYAESGGQIGDKGNLENNNLNFKVINTKKYGCMIGHIGRLISGTLKVDDYVKANVDENYRSNINLNHSATHLIHAALRSILGKHVIQKGSLIDDKILRFDFAHFDIIKQSQLYEIEDFVNSYIRRNLKIKTNILSFKEAKDQGAIFLLNKNYDEFVRVVNIDECSIELCGGTHSSYTGDIGLFRIISESGISTGIRRIKAVTGNTAIISMHKQDDYINNIKKLLNSDRKNLNSKILNIIKRNEQLEKELQYTKKYMVINVSANISRKAIKINDIYLIVEELFNIEPKTFSNIINVIKKDLGSVIIILATIIKHNVFLTAGISKNIIDQINAKELIEFIIKYIGGKGGGNLDMAYANSTNISSLPKALIQVKNWLSVKLQ